MALALLALAVTGQAGGAEPVDPVRTLQTTGRVIAVQFDAARATYTVWQVQWRSPRVDLQVLFGNNARAAVEGPQVREVTVVAARTSLPNPAAERRAVRQAGETLSRLCGLTLNAAPVDATAPTGWSPLKITALLPPEKPAKCSMPGPGH